MYYPEGYQVNRDAFGGKPVEGVFLVDSYSQMVVDQWTWDYYMGRMLRHLWERTGQVFMAVCAGGSALLNPSGEGLMYSQLLAEVPSGLQQQTPSACRPSQWPPRAPPSSFAPARAIP